MKNIIEKFKRKRRYLKVLYRIFKLHNFHFKCIHLILRMCNKRDDFLEERIETNSFIIESFRQDIAHLKKKMKVYDEAE